MVGPVNLWRMKRDFQIEFLKKFGLQPNHKFLDLGCGTLRGGIPIIDYLNAGNYTGVDVRLEAIEEGRKELAEFDLGRKEPNLVHSESFPHTAELGRYDLIWAYSLLIHLYDDQLGSMLDFVANHLAPRGRFMANVNIGTDKTTAPTSSPDAIDGSGKTCRVFPVVWRSLEFYERAAHKAGLSFEDMGMVRDLGFESGHGPHDNHHFFSLTR